MINKRSIIIDAQILKLIAELDEFKGRWEALGRLSPEKLLSLRRVATIESIGSSTRIEGAKLSDHEVEALLADLEIRSFRSRDEEEVAGYADTMNIIFESFSDIPLDENHIKQLHGMLLKHSAKDSSHRGQYKKLLALAISNLLKVPFWGQKRASKIKKTSIYLNFFHNIK